MNKSKVAIATSKIISLVQMLVGIVIISIFIFPTIFCLVDKTFLADTGVILLIFSLIMDALGIWLIVLSIKRIELINEFKKYVAVVSKDSDGYIPNIAASLGTSEDVVKKKIELMIKNKYFANAFIDCNSNCIVIVNKQNAIANTAHQPQTSLNAYVSPITTQATEIVTVKCKSCGGINTIQKGEIGECDYCGSPIKGE